jgi:hypothetical protein
MAGVKMPNTEAQIERMAIAVQEGVRSAIRRPTKKVGVKLKWKKVGDGWEFKKAGKKTYRSRIKATGNLEQNTKAVKIDTFSWQLQMPYYTYWLINGRKKGKGVPPQILQKWLKVKRIKPRNEKGRFVKMSREALGFLINRKIKYYGIDGNDFITPEIEDVERRYKSALTRAVNKDIELNLTNGN